MERGEQVVKIAAVSLHHLPNLNLCFLKQMWGKKAKVGLNAEKQSGRKSRSAKRPGTDVPSIYLIVQSIAFSRDPLVMTTASMTSLPEKMKLRGARKPGISKH